MPFKKKTKVSPEAEVDEESNESAPKAGANRGISELDLVMRMVAAIGTLGSALAVGTATESGPFFAGFFRFEAGYDDLPTFTFLVVTNAIVCGYLVLSLVLSIFHILKSSARVTRVILIILDTVMVAYLTGGASSAAAMVHLAHKGDGGAICQQHNSFCDRAAGALVGSFIGVVALLLLTSMSAVALSRH